jgi:hypothetical protein
MNYKTESPWPPQAAIKRGDQPRIFPLRYPALTLNFQYSLKRDK